MLLVWVSVFLKWGSLVAVWQIDTVLLKLSVFSHRWKEVRLNSYGSTVGKQVREEKSQVTWHAGTSEGVEQKGRRPRVLSQNQSAALMPNLRLQNASPQTYSWQFGKSFD